jgi:hypothetical protein
MSAKFAYLLRKGSRWQATGSSTRPHVIPTEAALAGILAALIDAREARIGNETNPEKSEVLLARAGLSKEDIAIVTGKQPDAVRKVIERAKPKKKRVA